MFSQKDPGESTKPLYSDREVIRDLYGFLKPYRAKFWVASFARLISDLVWLFPAYGVAAQVTILSSNDAPEKKFLGVCIVIILYAAAVLIRTLAQYFSRMWGYSASERAALDAQNLGVEHLYQLDLAWHEKENAGNKLKRVTSAGDAIDRSIRIWFNSIIEVLVNAVGMTVILATVDRRISFAITLFVVSYFFLSQYLLRRASAAAREVNAQEETMSGLMFEGLNNVRTVRALGIIKRMMRNIGEAADLSFDKVLVRITRFQRRDVALSFWINAFRVTGFLVIAYGITRGKYEVGFLLLFSGYFNRIVDSVSTLSDSVQQWVIGKFSIGRLMEILKTPVSPEGEAATRGMPKDWKTIRLERVSFSYGERDVLTDISLTIKRGEKIGIVGLSGAGKSTLFKLLLKENESYRGEILIDNVPLRSIKRSLYYEKVTVVLQETEVFNFSLKENITIAQTGKKADGKALDRSLEIAHVSAFSEKMPQGIDTIIGEKGVKLSGGERQRIGIARAIYKAPEVLFMDEATSHLDLESEEKIQDALHVFFKGVTAVVIAHRLTTIKEMDRIFVLEGGKLLEEGSFEELQSRRGRFFELWEKQKLTS
jgi:ABC-type multidrug transport system fused ATPase/permease subunit